MLSRGNLPLCVALAIAAAPPILAQKVPAIMSASAAQGAIPDFSGIWAHPYLTGFEPPASGPGPVRNRSRRPDGVANFQQLVGRLHQSDLKAPCSRSREEARREFAHRRRLSDPEQPVLARRCALCLL